MSEKSIFSQNLVKARKLKGWSQEGAASAIGIKRSVLGSYEEDRAEPPHGTLVKIARAYHIKDLQQFISDPNYFEPKVSPDEVYSRYLKLSWFQRKAVNAILGLDY
jgi:transcriptional regulator with XRE-family HTH domain